MLLININISNDLWLYLTLFLVLSALIVISIKLFSQKKVKSSVSETFLNELLEALGTFSNIEFVRLEQQRVQLNLVDTKLVNASFFTNQNIPAFLSGKKMTILFKEHAKEIYKFLTSQGA